MPYYPKSQIIQNLYTTGGEYILSTTKENYIGYYYKTFLGQKYTGKNPQDGANIKLTQAKTLNDAPNYTPNPSENNIYLNTSGYSNYTFIDSSTYPKYPDFKSRTLPTFNPTTPTDKDK